MRRAGEPQVHQCKALPYFLPHGLVVRAGPVLERDVGGGSAHWTPEDCGREAWLVHPPAAPRGPAEGRRRAVVLQVRGPVPMHAPRAGTDGQGSGDAGSDRQSAGSFSPECSWPSLITKLLRGHNPIPV